MLRGVPNSINVPAVVTVFAMSTNLFAEDKPMNVKTKVKAGRAKFGDI